MTESERESEYRAWGRWFPEEETLYTHEKQKRFCLVAVTRNGIELSIPVTKEKDVPVTKTRKLILTYERLKALWEWRHLVQERDSKFTTAVNNVWKKCGAPYDHRNEAQYWAVVLRREIQSKNAR